MPPSEMYPWSTLENVGDYFIVMEEFKPYVHMNATISVRNRNMRGRMKYVCAKTSYGSIVMVAQVADVVPSHEVEIVPGLYARTVNVGPSPVQLGNKPQAREFTQQEKVNRMTWQVRNANLPWWYDPVKRNLVVNPDLIKDPEAELFYRKQFNPGAETPYPDHYNLDENLMIREAPAQDEEDEDDDEGVPMIINDGADDVDIDDR